MKPLSERDENLREPLPIESVKNNCRNEATLWKGWEPELIWEDQTVDKIQVGMKPLSERDENTNPLFGHNKSSVVSRNEATLWKRWELQSPSTKAGTIFKICRNEATLWKRWERVDVSTGNFNNSGFVGMKPLSERDEKHMLNRNSDNGRVEWEGWGWVDHLSAQWGRVWFQIF